MAYLRPTGSPHVLDVTTYRDMDLEAAGASEIVRYSILSSWYILIAPKASYQAAFLAR